MDKNIVQLTGDKDSKCLSNGDSIKDSTLSISKLETEIVGKEASDNSVQSKVNLFEQKTDKRIIIFEDQHGNVDHITAL